MSIQLLNDESKAIINTAIFVSTWVSVTLALDFRPQMNTDKKDLNKSEL